MSRSLTRVPLATFKVNLGDLPTWLGVTFAAAAGAVALLLYLREAERDRQAREDRRVRDEEDRRAQAALVSVWYDVEYRPIRALITGRPESPSPSTRSTYLVRGAYLRNASDLPVYDVSISFHVIIANVNDEDWTDEVGVVRKRIVPPGQVFVDGPDDLKTRFKEIKEFAVAISFRDTAGRRWIRATNGMLVEDPSSNYLPRPAMPHGLQRRISITWWRIAALTAVGVAVLLMVV